MGFKTPLHRIHLEAHATVVDFGGWDMPLHYGSQLAEHHAVRRDAGMFDVSHMRVLDVVGPRAREYLRTMLANDVGKLTTPGRALYSCLLLPTGGVLDDLIAYHLTEQHFRLIVNAGTAAKDEAWLTEHARPFAVHVEARHDLAMIAVQGPQARVKTASLLSAEQRVRALDIAPFSGAPVGAWFLSRTGYTGEDGFELMLPVEQAAATWTALAAAGITPAGLGARDTLRLEAGLNLYGNDMDEGHHPLESGLAWTVAFAPATRDFIGRAALQRACGAAGNQLVGLLLDDRGVLRRHQSVSAPCGAAERANGDGRGEITSGTFSPTLNRSIALARVPGSTGPTVQVDVRGKPLTARVVRPPFVRHGKILIDL